MKATRYLVIFTMLAWLAAVAFANAPKPAGVVDDLTGQAEAKTGQDAPRKLAKGAPVFAQDVISTPTDKDKARISFADGSALEIGPQSMVALKDFAYDETNKDNSRQSIAMGKGIFRFVTGKVVAQNPDNLKIESPLSVIGIRGTTTDHWIQTRQKNVGGKTVTDVEAELHALRETKSGSEVVVKSETETLVLKKPGDVAWVRPKLPGSVRPLTEEEKQSFGSSSTKRESFDPAPPRRGIPGGGG
jgi:hypothetical protein